MIYNIELSDESENDLLQSRNYIKDYLMNPIAAKRFMTFAKKELASLDTFPERNPLVRDNFLSGKGVRMHIIKNYLAFYVIHEDIHTVYILRVLHSRQDWSSILKNDFLTNT